MPSPRLRSATVENPHFSPAHDGDKTNPREIDVVINARESAITTLAVRGKLDAAQVAAATRFRALWEAMEGVRAVNYGKVVVDGGRPPEPLTERQINAGKELRRCRVLLGARGYRPVSLVCGQGHALTEIAPGKRERLTAADMLRMSLDDLAELWHLATRRPDGRRVGGLGNAR